jgi:uncharacterized protein (DUF885 family)
MTLRPTRHTVSTLATAGIIAITLLVGCAKSPDATPSRPASRPDWAALVDEYVSRYFEAHPSFAAQQGRHEFDGRLPDWTAQGIRGEIQRLKTFRARVASIAPATLDATQQFEREYLLARIDRDLFWTETAAAPFRNPEFYLGMSDGGDSLDPTVYISRPYDTPEHRLRAFILYAHEVVRVAPAIRENLNTPLSAPYIKLGVAGFGGLADFYRKDVPQAFAAVHDRTLQAELQAAIEPAARAMESLAHWMKDEAPKASGIDALGAERFQAMLKMTERVEVPLADLEAAGRADLDRNSEALLAACHAYAPGSTVRQCVDRVATHKPVGGAVVGTRAQLASLRQFILDHDLMTIPGDEQADVAESPPFNRQNGAYIDVPGPYDHGLASVFYISPPDPTWSKAEQQAYIPDRASLLFTSVHEVWPGHFLQFMHANRAKSKLASLWVGYAYAEGWAHYSEELMWEKGLGGDPETHIGQLTNALLRDARFLSSIGMHTHGMSIAESEQLFRERAFTDAGTARQQAARGTYDPAYLDYTLGKLMIRKLRSDYCASRGGESCWKDFHDRFLSYGGPPIPLVRAAMLGADAGPVL